MIQSQLTSQVSISNSKVEGTETFAGEDSGPVIEILEDVLEMLVHLRAKSKVVHEHNS